MAQLHSFLFLPTLKDYHFSSAATMRRFGLKASDIATKKTNKGESSMKNKKMMLAALCLCVLSMLGVNKSLSTAGDITSALVAVDSEGKEIGKVLRTYAGLERVQVAIAVEDLTVMFFVGTDVFSHPTRPFVFFETDDCSGLAYISANASTSFGTPAAVAGPEETLYIGDPDTVLTRPIRSVLYIDSCVAIDYMIEVMDASPALELGREFTPPYTVTMVGR
ncbi:MAG: hypothetical protein JRI67_10610 [Deltaproteobacteria bacterium]|nr:hypothetical protein [Deltaproteobacteria bacterium]